MTLTKSEMWQQNTIRSAANRNDKGQITPTDDHQPRMYGQIMRGVGPR